MTLESLEELKSGQIGINLQPFAHLTPARRERIDPRPPMPGRFRHRSMSGPYFADSPRRGKTCEKAREIISLGKCSVRVLAVGDTHDVMLDAADLVEQLQRVELRSDLVQ